MNHIGALIISPTRELAQQIHEVLANFLTRIPRDSLSLRQCDKNDLIYFIKFSNSFTPKFIHTIQYNFSNYVVAMS